MLKVNSRVRRAKDGLEGSVTSMWTTHFSVRWDGSSAGDVLRYGYCELFNTPDSAAIVIEIQDDIPLNVALANIGSERSMAMSHNIGRMEYTIEILFDHITRMRGTADMYGHLEVVADCDSLRDTITRCALALQDMPSVDGGSKPTELKTYIAARQ